MGALNATSATSAGRTPLRVCLSVANVRLLGGSLRLECMSSVPIADDSFVERGEFDERGGISIQPRGISC